MKVSELDKEKIIEQIKALPDSYWSERFKALCNDREEKLTDLEAEIVYLFDLTRTQLMDLIETYIAKYAVDGQVNYDVARTKLNRLEVKELKNYISSVESDMKKENLSFDKDTEERIKNINTKTNRETALELKIQTKLSYLYNVINKRVYENFGNVTEDFYYHTLYEVIKASGYDSNKINDLKLMTLATLLAETWRSTGETFDDAIWRYGRSFMVDLVNTYKKNAFAGMSDEEIIMALEKLFGSKYHELERSIETDMTYFSTLGQSEAFTNLEIDTAIFTAILDERTSEFCREADGNIIPVEEIQPWVNSPPLHYFCRSTLVPVVKSVNWLTGDVYEVEGNFDGWYESHWG